MKNKNLIPFLFFAVLLFAACDFITKPYEPTPPPPPPTDSTRYILLEDYTGHYCPNCPEAAITAKKIKDENAGRVIVIGLHVSDGFAKPHKNDEFTADFRTEAGNTYDLTTAFGMSVGGLPKGMVNRKNFKAGSLAHILVHGSWAGEVSNEIATNPNAVVKLAIENGYDAKSRELECTINSTFFYDTLTSGPYYLVVSIVQDSIIAPQKKGAKTDLNYVHNHVLRDNINGTWGTKLVAKGKITKGLEIKKTYTYTFPNAYPELSTTTTAINQTPCEVSNCHIVAYIYNDETKEVIQVAEEKVIQ